MQGLKRQTFIPGHHEDSNEAQVPNVSGKHK